MAQRVIRLKSTSSTQDEARRLWASGRAGVGDVVLADTQTEGRGRCGRSWVSPTGGLYTTFLLQPTPLMPLRTGLALAAALTGMSIDAQLKWPNDVLVSGRKIAGMLVEMHGGVAFLGLGVNVESAPFESSDCVHNWNSSIVPEEILCQIRHAMEQWLTCTDGETLAAYRATCCTLGIQVRIERTRGQIIEGTAIDINTAGCLQVRTSDVVRTVCSGDCLHLRVA